MREFRCDECGRQMTAPDHVEVLFHSCTPPRRRIRHGPMEASIDIEERELDRLLALHAAIWAGHVDAEEE